MRIHRFTPEQERVFEETEQLHTRATIYELGVAEYLKSHMPCAAETEIASNVLRHAVDLRRSATQRRERIQRASGTKSSTGRKRARSDKKRKKAGTP